MQEGATSVAHTSIFLQITVLVNLLGYDIPVVR